MKNIKKKVMKINLFGSKAPRSVDDIIGSFTDTINELEERVEADKIAISEANQVILEQQRAIAEAEGSKSRAIAIKSRIQDLLGIK